MRNDGCDSAYADERVALPNRNRVSASHLKYETPDGHRCRPDENSTEQDSPDSPLLCILDCNHKGQVQAPDRKRKYHSDAKTREIAPAPVKSTLTSSVKRVTEKSKEPNHRPMRLNVFVKLLAPEIDTLHPVATD